MNQTKMNIESAYSITSVLVSEIKIHAIPSRLHIKINNKKEFYLRSVISKVKKEKYILRQRIAKHSLKSIGIHLLTNILKICLLNIIRLNFFVKN